MVKDFFDIFDRERFGFYLYVLLGLVFKCFESILGVSEEFFEMVEKIRFVDQIMVDGMELDLVENKVVQVIFEVKFVLVSNVFMQVDVGIDDINIELLFVLMEVVDKMEDVEDIDVEDLNEDEEELE